MLIDKSINIPLIDFRKSPDGDEYVNLQLFSLGNGEAMLKLYLTNITEYPMKDFHVQSLELFTYDFKYIISENGATYNPHNGLPKHYDTYASFVLLSVPSEEFNEHFERISPGGIVGNTLQQDAKAWTYNKQFILKIHFEIKNIYGRVIRETILCEFRGKPNKENP